MEQADCIVIGAGVIGLACARALALQGRDVIILEAENAFGTATSARNSEVIHAGLYYPAGSLRARMCVQGRHALYAFCRSHGVAHRRCGKLVVACSPEEITRLAQVEAHARANGVDDLQLLDGWAARQREPSLQCEAALLSPSTGIIDSHGLMLALLGEAQAHGAMLALLSPVTGGRATDAGIELDVGGEVATRLRARTVVNAAGLYACQVASSIEGMPAKFIPRPYYAQGAYFSCSAKVPFSHLIYPVPGESSHLGVHLTLDLGGQGRFGPSFRWLSEVDYAVREEDSAGFTEAVRRYWPGLPDGALHPGYAGVRPKISGPGEPAADFRLDDESVHGIPGLFHFFGIESPGLTSCLPLAQWVAEQSRQPCATLSRS